MKLSYPRRRIAQVVSGVILLSLVVGAVLGLRSSLKTQSSDPSRSAPVAAAPGGPVREGSVGPFEKTGPAGPFEYVSDPPNVYNGSLLDLVGTGTNPAPMEKFGLEENGEEKTPNVAMIEENLDFTDPVAQTFAGNGQMPAPIMSFDGLDINDGGGWHPPDTSGDVGMTHYIQNVNIGIGIYDKATGAELVNLPFNSFFSPAPSPCSNQNRGDVVVLYDSIAHRWLVTDFSLPATGPVYECIAVSQGEDPTANWYYYAVVADEDGEPWNDYPKLGVWVDGYYMTANMFDPWSGVYVWALNRDDMINGLPVKIQKFEVGAAFGSALPATVRGTPPAAGTPEYLTAFDFPNTLHIWKLFIDWDTPLNSHLDGPTDLETAPAAMIDGIPQKGTGQVVDTLGDRLMFQLQYRNFGDFESLWVNHTVSSGGVAGIRWYEVRDLAATPTLYQQGTYQPDDGQYRWMGSLGVDQDGNMAVGYSVSSTTLFPAIRYAGRLDTEQLGALPQAEHSLIEGLGSQSGSNRWGDYSQMNVDPADDCTFWYTTEYFKATSGSWYTRIGSFKFPSCGLPKGWIEGFVRDAISNEPLAGIPVEAVGTTVDVTLRTTTDAVGHYFIKLPADTFELTAGPLAPVYPGTDTATVVLAAAETKTQDFQLAGVPVLNPAGYAVDDNVPGGNNNGYPEPGEAGLLFTTNLSNDGAGPSTGITAILTSLTPGVTVTSAGTSYPDIPAGGSAANSTPFEFSIDPSYTCGNMITFQEDIVSAEGNYTFTFVVPAGVPEARAEVFFDNMENGVNGWAPGGSPNTWAQITTQSHSPTHSWTDSPSGQYQNNMNSWVKSPVIHLTGMSGIQLDFWHRYNFESGWDYGYPEYSFNNSTWQSFYPNGFTGNSGAWLEQNFDASFLDGQPDVYLRFRSYSDGGVTADGWYIDDVAVSYQPYSCTPAGQPPDAVTLLSPADGAVFSGAQQIELSWTASADATDYELVVDGNVFPTTETSMSFLVGPGAHTWYVRAHNANGYSAPTETWDFMVNFMIYLSSVTK